MEREKITEGNYYFSLEIVARKNVQNEINTTPRARVIVMKCSAVGSLILFIINGMKLKFF